MRTGFLYSVLVICLTFLAAWSLPECSFRQCHSAFAFRNRTVSAIDADNDQRLCPVGNFTLNRKYEQLQNYTIAVIGDSLDLHSCFELMRRMGKLTYDKDGIPMASPAQKPSKGIYDCYTDEHMQVKFLRIGGMMDSTGVPRIDSGVKMSFLLATQPDAVVFSSIVHDIRNNHLTFCQKKAPPSENSVVLLQRKCLCDHLKMETPECLKVSTPHVYNQIEMPWCDEDFVDSWRAIITSFVTEIRAALPDAAVFLRNQPFASQVQLGHQICLGSVNNIMREIATSLIPPNERGHSCRFLDMSALLARAASDHMGYTTSLAHRDGLHYFKAADIWVDYMLNLIVDNALPAVSV